MSIGLKRQVWGALAIGVAIGTIGTRRETAAMLRAAQAQDAVQKVPEVAAMRRASIEDKDAARLLPSLHLQNFKWNYSLPAIPENSGITARFWIEDWQRNSRDPKYHHAGSVGMDPRGTLMIKMPRFPHDDFVAVTPDAIFNTGTDFTPILGSKSVTAFEDQPIAFNRDITLMCIARNESGQYPGDPRTTPHYERANDRTVYLKVRFTTPSVPASTLKNGRIELK